MLEVPGIIDGRYRVDRRASEGGFGTVYAGLHMALGVPVAIKVLRLARLTDPAARQDQIERFLEEGRLLTRLRHPNIVAALDLGVVHEPDSGLASPYLVMEWVEGPTLRQHMVARGRPCSIPEAWRLFEPIADALAHAHRALVVHRDITPNNVMLVAGESGVPVPRVIDLGVAKAFAPDEAAGHGTTETATPNPFTPAYAAPEQVTQARTGPWTDVHALGLLFIELVTGAPPYGRTGNPRFEVVDPERPSARARGVDLGPLEPVIAKAVALRPSDRYANAGELLEAARAAMRAMGSDAPVHAARAQTGDVLVTEAPASRTVAPSAPRRLSRGMLLGASIVAAGVLAAGGAAWVVEPRLHRSVKPAPSAAHAPARPSLDTLTESELVKRTEAAAGSKVVYRATTPAPMRSLLAGWTGAHGGLAKIYTLNVVDTPGKSHADARFDAMMIWLHLMPAGAEYGATDHSLAIVNVPSGGAHKLFDRIFAGLPMPVRGTWQGSNGNAGTAAAQERTPLTAKRLHDVSLDELAARLRRQGVKTSSKTQATPSMGQITFTRGAATGTLLSYKSGVRTVLPGLLRLGGTQAYAVDGDAFVVVSGDGAFCNAKFLSAVLAGLGATVRVHTG